MGNKGKELDYIGIFKEFNKKKIRYIVCGGLAVNLLGIPRMTYDIDFLFDMGENNLKKLLKLLREWGFKPRASVNMEDFLAESKRQEWIKRKGLRAFNFYNSKWPISEIDILINVSLDYKQAVKDVIYKRIGNMRVPVISPKNLIKMKQRANRKQDKADIRYLKRII